MDYKIETLGERTRTAIVTRPAKGADMDHPQAVGGFISEAKLETYLQGSLDIEEAKWLVKNYPNLDWIPFSGDGKFTKTEGRKFILLWDIWNECFPDKVQETDETTNVSKETFFKMKRELQLEDRARIQANLAKKARRAPAPAKTQVAKKKIVIPTAGKGRTVVLKKK